MMNQDWINWTTENLKRGCNPQEIFDILTKNNFLLADIGNAMGAAMPVQANMPKPLTPGEYKALVEYPVLRLGRFPGARCIANPKIQLYTVDHFFTDEECDRLIALANTQLRPSTLTVYAEGFRTSSTGDLHFIKDPFIDTMEQKLCAGPGINPTFAEPGQAQKYLVGQEFKAHTDYFEPNTKEYEKFGGIRGQRTWTLMVYLNNTPKGGGTNFPKLGITLFPKKGQAVVWNNLQFDGRVNPDSMHAGMPVEEGEKLVVTKWFREQGKGVMFPDLHKSASGKNA